MNKLIAILVLMIVAIWYLGDVTEGIFQTANAYHETRNSKAVEILFGK